MPNFRVLSLGFATLCALGLALASSPPGARAADTSAQSERPQTQLIMISGNRCHYCETWKREVGDAYPLTEEGRKAPLRSVDANKKMPADIAHLSSRGFTPTFIVTHCNQEVGRIVGYPGESFFWQILKNILEKVPEDAC